MNKVDIIVGSIFRKRRKEMRMTQTQLGDKIGMPFSTLAGYERGIRGMSLETYFVLCEALQLDPNEVQEEVKRLLDDDVI